MVTVKLYSLGSLVTQMTTSKGRVVFILNRLGDFTITADATGYRTAQKEISVPLLSKPKKTFSSSAIRHRKRWAMLDALSSPEGERTSRQGFRSAQ